MMKTFALHFFAFFLFSALMAQDWHPFPGNMTFAFTFQQPYDNHTWLFAAQSDSVVAEGQDSAYYLYRIKRPAVYGETMLGCDSLIQYPDYLVNQDHYLGKKMLWKPNGDAYFIFSNGDSLLLRTHAPVGSTWNWSSALTATVDSIASSSVLGQTDSVKYISLSDGKLIQLSKAHGFLRTFSFIPFVSDTIGTVNTSTVDFHLWGIHEMNLGRRIPDFHDIFDYHPGDRVGQYSEVITVPLSSSSIYLRKLITIDSLSTGSDLVFDGTVETHHTEQPNLWSTPPTITHFVDSQAQVLFPHASHAHLDLLPYQDDGQGPELGTYFFFPRGMFIWDVDTNRILMRYIQAEKIDTCFPGARVYSWRNHNHYLTGVGHYYSKGGGIEVSRFMYVSCFETSSGNFGNCANLIIGNDEPQQAVDFQIAPNPCTGRFRIQFSSAASAKTIRVFSALGQLVLEENIRVSVMDAEINLEKVPDGVYLIRVEGRNALPTSKRIVVQR